MVVAACDKPSTTGRDAGTTGDADTTDSDTSDASTLDAASDIDAPMGMLSSEPLDPVSLLCTGKLGFPGIPAVRSDSNTAQGLRMVDLNVDGISDIASGESGAIRFALGNGDGTFAASTTFAVPLNAHAFRVVDVNADGKPDLVFGGSQQHFVQVALNNGSTAFGDPQSYDITANILTEELEVTDIDGDGRPDIVGLYSGGKVFVLLNTGSSFSAAQLYDVGGQYTYQFSVGDVTGDGRPDVVVANYVGAVSVLANIGGGVFADRVVYGGLESAWSIELGDLNEDGSLDVAVGTTNAAGDTRVSVLLNQGGGVLGPVTSYEAVAVGAHEPRVLAIGDINGDGHLDVGASQTLRQGSTVLLGTGTGQLGTRIDLDADQPSGSMAFSDLDRDGRLDLVLVNGYSITPYLNNGTASLFDLRSRYRFGVPMTNRGVRMTDLNGDGRLDLIGLGEVEYGPPSSAMVLTRLTNPSGSFSPVTTSYAPGIRLMQSTLTDLDNDNDQDLLVLGYGQNFAAGLTLLNGGNGTLSMTAQFPMPYSITGFGIGDFNSDGWRDLVVASRDGTNYDSKAQYFRGLGNGEFAPGTVIWTGRHANGVAVLDLDADGKLDVVIDHYATSARRELLPGLGNGTFASPTHMSLPDGVGQLAVRDFNGDGKQDVLGFGSAGVAVTLGNGNGTLALALISPMRAYGVPAFGDFNGDGVLDVAGISGPTVAVGLGQGNGRFDAPKYYDGGGGPFDWPTTISAGDVDGDGRVDILINNYQDRISVLRSRCLP